ncbi:unnamed protein product [Tuber aestivum]|uniref:Uncharacterized protein n=1 Tax=Tuber aestivum TaxID=59557 RepID=A0A292PY83_9PEZI|nr:unnamed protein product [Tuber aestivum]
MAYLAIAPRLQGQYEYLVSEYDWAMCANMVWDSSFFTEYRRYICRPIIVRSGEVRPAHVLRLGWDFLCRRGIGRGGQNTNDIMLEEGLLGRSMDLVQNRCDEDSVL